MAKHKPQTNFSLAVSGLLTFLRVAILICLASWQSVWAANVAVPSEIKRQLMQGDYDHATVWLTQAAKTGHGHAALTLGNLYRTGQGVKQDNAMALSYLEIAANKEIPQAQYQLGVLLIREGQTAQGTRWIRRAANNKHTQAASYFERESLATTITDPFTLMDTKPPPPSKDYGLEFWSKTSDQGLTPLLHAIHKQHTPWVNYLLAKLPKSAFDAQDKQGNAPLHFAALQRDNKTVQLLLTQGANPNVANNKGATPLHTAIGNDSTNIVKTLIKHGADLSIKDASGWSGQMLADRNQKITGTLGATNQQTRRNKPQTAKASEKALFRAIKRGETQKISQLLKAGTNPNLLNLPNKEGSSPLLLVVRHGTPEQLAMLIDAGLALAPTTTEQAVLESIRTNQAKMLEKLIQYGVNVKATGKSNRTSLHHAVLNECYSCIDALLAAGVDAFVRDDNGQTALLAATYTANERAGTRLLDHPNMPIQLADLQGRTPLWWSASNNLPATTHALLTNGAKQTADHQSRTPLQVALTERNSSISLQLLETATEQDLSVTDATGHSLLHIAASQGQLSAMQVLMEKEIDIDIPSHQGDTPLMLAVGASQPRAANALVEAGASLNRRNAKLQSARSMMTSQSDPVWQAILDEAPTELESLWVRLTKE